MAKKKKTKQAIADEWYEMNKGNIDWSDKFNRERFRQTTSWKRFNEKIRKHTCDSCTLHSKRISLHHKDPKNYDDLTSSKFASLCYRCHTISETLSKKKNQDNIPDHWKQFLTE